MTLNQVLIPLHDITGWQQALSRVPGHQYTHTHWYNHAMHTASRRDIFLYHAHADNFAVVCPVSPRQKTSSDPLEITTPYGFSGFAAEGRCEDFAEQWRQFMADQGYVCGHIALHPMLQQDFLYQQNELHAGKKTFFIDLTQSIEAIQRALATDHRQRFRQWQKAGYSVQREKSPAVIEAFIALYKEALAARHAAAVYDFGDAAWRELMAANDSYLFSVTVNGVVEAAALFIANQTIADYYMIASTDAGRLHARGIVMDAVQFFHDMKLQWLHLGCGIREGDALEQFKARFGGSAYVTYALKQVYDEHAYHAVCQKYGCDPAVREGYFPGYWALATT